MLQSTGRGTVGGARRLRQTVLTAQVAVSIVLLVASGLLVRSLVERLRVDTGFHPDRVVTFELTLPPSSYPEELRGPIPASRPRIVSAVDAVLARLRAMPGVASAAAGKPLPMSGAQEATVYTVEGVAPLPGEQRRLAEYIVAGGDASGRWVRASSRARTRRFGSRRYPAGRRRQQGIRGGDLARPRRDRKRCGWER